MEKLLTSDKAALDFIAEAMSGKEWSPDTLEIIAGVVRLTGRAIDDIEDTP